MTFHPAAALTGAVVSIASGVPASPTDRPARRIQRWAVDDLATGPPLTVTVIGDPGAARDSLVRALAASALMRIFVETKVTVGQYGSSPQLVVLCSVHPSRDVLAVLAINRNAALLVVSPRTDRDEIVQTLRAGACSYLLEGHFDTGEFVAAALGTASGRSHLSSSALAAVVHRLRHSDETTAPGELAGSLSRRQRQVMELVAAGRSNHEIARATYISEKTVRNHLNEIYARLGVRSRSDAILVWLGRTPSPSPRR
jgi:DNA-binding NarL/FixJ family response regulator